MNGLRTAEASVVYEAKRMAETSTEREQRAKSHWAFKIFLDNSAFTPSEREGSHWSFCAEK